MKVLMMAASLGTILLVWKGARRLGRDPVMAIVLVGLNPLVLMWGLGGVHNDFITVFFIVLGFYLLLRAGLADVAPADRVQPVSRGVGEPNGRAGAEPNGRADARASILDVGALAGSSLAVEPRGAPGTGVGRRLRGWFVPLVPLELGAGAALVAATSLKASAGIVILVVLAGLLHAPRRLVQVALGMLAAGVVLGTCSLLAFGPHLPDLGTQGRLVIAVSLPNLLGLALGQGGETEVMRTLLSVVLIASVLASGLLAWRWRDSLTASGWATIALLVTLSWVLPWYILWVLPMAALSRSRKLRVAALALGAYLILTWVPLATAMDNAVGFHPSKTTLGQLHQRYVQELLN
jgi:hypothetical protein